MTVRYLSETPPRASVGIAVGRLGSHAGGLDDGGFGGGLLAGVLAGLLAQPALAHGVLAVDLRHRSPVLGARGHAGPSPSSCGGAMCWVASAPADGSTQIERVIGAAVFGSATPRASRTLGRLGVRRVRT